MQNQPTQHETLPIDQSEVKFWHNEITASEKFMKNEFTSRINYSVLVKYFEGLQNTGDMDLNHMVILDEISPGISSIISQVIFQNPSVDVRPNHPKAEGNIQVPLLFQILNPDFKPYSLAELMDGALKHLMKQCGLKEELQLALFDIIVAGFCVVEMNHQSQPLLRPTQKFEEETLAQPIEKTGLQKFGGEVMDFVKDTVRDPLGTRAKSEQETEDDLVKKGKYERYGFRDSTYCERWDPRDILFDSRAQGRFKKSTFVGKRIRMSMAEFNTLYPTFKDQVPSEDRHDMEFAEGKRDNDRKGATVFELQIKEDDGLRILLLAKGIAEALDNYKLPFTTNDFTLKYGSLDKYGRIYPMSRIMKSKRAQDVINKLATLQLEHATRALRKTAVWESGLTPEGKTAMASSNVYAVVNKTSPAAVFEAAPELPTTIDNPIMRGELRESINKNIGANEIVKSGKSENELLGQDQLEQQAFDVKASQVQDSIGDVVNQLLNTGKDIIMQLWEEQDHFRISGKSGSQFWYTPEMGPIADLMEGDYLLSINMVSAQKPNPISDRNDALSYAQWVMSVDVQQYMLARNKITNMNVVENVMKQFNQNPEANIEDLQPVPGLPTGEPNAPTDNPNQPGQAQVPEPEQIINQGGG